MIRKIPTQTFRSPIANKFAIKQIQKNPRLSVEEIPEDKILFYDIETDHQFPQYCSIRLIGVQYGFCGSAINFNDPNCAEAQRFREALADPSIVKVGFNNCNFDDIALQRHGYPVNPINRHDGYLMMKCIAPRLASYALKYINWFYFNDPHFPEMKLQRWMKKTKLDWKYVPEHILSPYLKHDLFQHMQVFKLAWDIVQEDRHWDAYALDLSQGYVTEEMILDGGLWIDKKKAVTQIALLQNRKEDLDYAAHVISDGEITNANSSKQLGAYLDEEGFELELSSNGDFAVRKSDLVELREKSPIAECAYQIRGINAELSQIVNYNEAAQEHSNGWIPYAVSISSARTRRFLSGSYYGINFQNPSKAVKKIQYVPPGWLGTWIDSTQVENVIHIYESEDDARRRAYEADPDWNEYVWLCNRIQRMEKDKAYWDSLPSPQIPNWSIYRQFKTVKLGLNFGMGPKKYAKSTGLDVKLAYDSFDLIHEACPAIHRLQDKVVKLIKRKGYVQDVFDHIYSGTSQAAYKVVAYLIQGCGTGSLPKAQLRANYETIHQYDSGYKKNGLMCGTTHDESAMRIRLSLGPDKIFALLQELMFNMTKRFEHKFDKIPLRAKMYLSTTNTPEETTEDIFDLTTKQGKAKFYNLFK